MPARHAALSRPYRLRPVKQSGTLPRSWPRSAVPNFARAAGTRRSRWLLAAVAGAPAVACAPALAASARAPSCVTSLPIAVSTASQYAAAYRHVLNLKVSTTGPKISRLYVGLYTFSGGELGQGSLQRTLSGTATVKIGLRYGLQAGKYTLYVQGYPNASLVCGPKHTSRVLNFLTCATKLPVTFPDPPSGDAASFTGQIGVGLRHQRGPDPRTSTCRCRASRAHSSATLAFRPCSAPPP